MSSWKFEPTVKKAPALNKPVLVEGLPGIGNVGPALNYSEIQMAGKWFLSFLMLVGRLELFTVLVLFSPLFWRR